MINAEVIVCDVLSQKRGQLASVGSTVSAHLVADMLWAADLSGVNPTVRPGNPATSKYRVDPTC